jgi:hypothetical protein
MAKIFIHQHWHLMHKEAGHHRRKHGKDDGKGAKIYKLTRAEALQRPALQPFEPVENGDENIRQ